MNIFLMATKTELLSFHFWNYFNKIKFHIGFIINKSNNRAKLLGNISHGYYDYKNIPKYQILSSFYKEIFKIFNYEKMN